MKQRFIASVLGAASVALAGCSSVDQVPLVYVSTAKVGINVESGSAETPGASIMIGVDLTDAAYVPVAVTRYCRGDTVEMMKLCVNDLAEIELIKGKSDDFTENDKARIAQLATEASDLSKRMENTANGYSRALEAQAEAAARFRDAELADKLATELTQEKSRLVDQAAFAKEGQLVEAKKVAGELAQRQGVLTGANQNLTSKRNALNTDNGTLDRLMKSFAELIPQRNGNSLGQDDALSVFGTFSGRLGGKAGTETATNVTLGKSFSTGIAAQHLSRGFADREKIFAEKRSECIKAVTDGYAKLPAGSQTPEIMKILLAKCEA
jgi:hypothetical protein